LIAKLIFRNLHLTSADLAFAEEYGKDLSLDDIRRVSQPVINISRSRSIVLILIQILTNALKIHEHDPNYPAKAIEQAKEFLNNPDIMANPERHAKLIHDVKVEAALMDGHSPYETVRSVVSNTDDPTLPVRLQLSRGIGSD
jgi:urease gamma subunit